MFSSTRSKFNIRNIQLNYVLIMLENAWIEQPSSPQKLRISFQPSVWEGVWRSHLHITTDRRKTSKTCFKCAPAFDTSENCYQINIALFLSFVSMGRRIFVWIESAVKLKKPFGLNWQNNPNFDSDVCRRSKLCRFSCQSLIKIV